jgi:hypothetical protein
MIMHPSFLKRTGFPLYVIICSIPLDSYRLLKLYDVINGLVYLHGLGVVHTDLKGVCLTTCLVSFLPIVHIGKCPDLGRRARTDHRLWGIPRYHGHCKGRSHDCICCIHPPVYGTGDCIESPFTTNTGM